MWIEQKRLDKHSVVYQFNIINFKQKENKYILQQGEQKEQSIKQTKIVYILKLDFYFNWCSYSY